MKIPSVLLLTACAFLGTCSEIPPLVERILLRGELRVVTRNSPVAYYLGAQGPRGPEFDLAAGFARRLGVDLRIYVADTFESILPDVMSGRADLAAAGITVTPQRASQVYFGPRYKEVEEYLVYKLGEGKPRSLEDLVGSRLEIVTGSSYTESLERLRTEEPRLTWVENLDMEVEDLLGMVSNGKIDYTISDSNEFAVSRHYYPEIRAGFAVRSGQGIAWAFRRNADQSLIREAEAYFEDVRESGRLARINEIYYGHADTFDYVGTRSFLRDIDRKLPHFRFLFEEAAKATGMDWRLLAAMGYQESHWNPQARSPTGVRGLMMLTNVTAEQLGIEDRLDPEQSILGGARYFQLVKSKIPERIPEPDRTWLALAAYNVGFGHLEDARIITQIEAQNPDSWADVRESLPLLAQKRWYSRVKRGYARGWEPANYVENIRKYYSILQWRTQNTNIQSAQRPANQDKKPATEGA